MSHPTSAPRAPSIRDPRLDVFRGICLVMIFINHVPGNLYEDFTSRNFGFSDAAEGFVLMSGIAAGLAYSLDFRARSLQLWTGLARVWRRVWTLYLVHILTTLAALAAASAVAIWLNNSESLFENQMKWVWQDPLPTFVGLVLLTHQFGYVNILPLYLVLLAVAPLLLFAAWRRPMWLMAGSVTLWAVAGIWHLSLPNYPSKGGWFFNPLTWQVIFVTGLLTGVALKEGRRLVPVQRWLQVVTGLFLIYAALSTRSPPCQRSPASRCGWPRKPSTCRGTSPPLTRPSSQRRACCIFWPWPISCRAFPPSAAPAPIALLRPSNFWAVRPCRSLRWGRCCASARRASSTPSEMI